MELGISDRKQFFVRVVIFFYPMKYRSILNLIVDSDQ
jgi:hypothetical protein